MIDIIIPCYNAHGTLDIALQSICTQTIRDKCKILLVDDCSRHGYDDFINSYKDYLDISILQLEENGGAGVARRKGLEITNLPYVIFLDSDDLFMDADSVALLFSKIEEGYDMVNSYEYDEKRKGKLILNGNIHGKIYRRSYLEKKNITFNDTRFHEDNYFNNYVLLSGANCYSLEECTYYYTYNSESITNARGTDFERLEIYLSNMADLMKIAMLNNYNNYQVERFKSEKYRYLNRIYKSFNDIEKKEFYRWALKYDEDILKHLDTYQIELKDE